MRPTPVRFLLVIFLMLAGIARADVVVMKNGIRYETDKAFHSAGATYFKKDGALTSVPDADVLRIEEGATLTPPKASNFLPGASPAASLLKKAKSEIEKTDSQFIHECRGAIESEARLAKSDFKATCARALQMVERMYDGEMPADGTFGYYLEVLNNQMMYEILPADKSKKLKDTIFKKDAPVDKFMKPYELRVKEAAIKAAHQQEEAIKAQKAIQARQAKLKAKARLQPAPARGNINRQPQNRSNTQVRRSTARH